MTTKENLKTSVFQHSVRQIKHDLLDVNSGKCNASEYFKQISDHIDLTNLYKPLSTCYYSSLMPYCPVLLEVCQEKIREFLGGYQYLLQAWEVKTQDKKFQLPLKHLIKCWAICDSYLIYVVDDGADLVHIVNLDNENSVQTVKNLITNFDVQYLSLMGGVLLAASSSGHIKVLPIPSDSSEIHARDVDLIELGVSLHGIVLDMDSAADESFTLILESPDNQLDFNDFSVSFDEGFQYAIVQQTERWPRKELTFDSISKVEYRVCGTHTFALALRDSGLVDIYSDMCRSDTVENLVFLDIGLTFDFAFFKTTTGDTYTIKSEGKATLNFSQAEKEDENNLFKTDWDNIFMPMIKPVVRVYAGFAIQRDHFQAIIFHDQFVSFYDLYKRRWISHAAFDEKIHTFFPLTWKYTFPCFILKSGDFYYLDYSALDEHGAPHKIEKIDSIPGNIVRTSYDEEENMPVFVVSKDEEGSVYLHAVCKDANIVQLETDTELDANFHIEAFKVQEELYLLIQNNGQHVIKTVRYAEDRTSVALEEFTKIKDIGGIEGRIHSVVSYDLEDHVILFDDRNCVMIKFNPYSLKTFANVHVQETLANQADRMTFILTSNMSKCFDQGLNYLDVQSTLKRNELTYISVVDCETGALPNIDWVLDRSRLAFISGMKTLIVLPIPYLNLNRLYTHLRKEHISIYQSVELQHVTFESESRALRTYDIVTGKQVHKEQVEFNIDGFTQFSIRGYQTLIFKSEKDYSNLVKVEDFFLPWQLETYVKNQKSFRASTTGEVPICLFKEVEIKGPREIGTVLEFLYPCLENLHLLSNKNKDMVITRDDFGAQIYKCVPMAGKEAYKVKLEMIRVLNLYPYDLNDYYKYRQDCFNPSFSKFLCYNSSDQLFEVRDTMTEQLVAAIPRRYLNPAEFEEVVSYQMYVNRTQWMDDDILRVCSKDGLEKLLDTERGMEPLAFNQIPLFNQVLGEEWRELYHIYISRKDTKDKVLRSKMIYQEVKSQVDLLEKHGYGKSLNQIIASIDFENFISFSHGFTLLQWKIAEEIQDGRITIKDLSEDILQHIIYAIFPGGNTIFHFIAEKPDQLQALLEFCHPDGEIAHHIPILSNFNQESPLHVCVKKKLYRSLDLFLKYMKLYPIDHHSRAIKDILDDIMKLDVPNFCDYMESRIQKNEFLKAIEYGNLIDESPAFMITSPLLDVEDYEKQLIDKNSDVDKKISLELLDVSHVFHFNDPLNDKFFDTLASIQKGDVFKLRSIQTLIDFNYPLVQKYLIRRLFLPYVVFHIVFLFTIFEAWESRFEGNMIYLYVCSMLVTLTICTFFFVNEMRQILNEGPLMYFSSFWNYIDTVPLFGIYIMAIFSFVEIIISSNQSIQDDYQRIIVSIVVLFMWFKLLYFFRLFDSTSYLIRIIVTVVLDMKNFFLVFVFMNIGLGNAFLVLSNGNTAENQFTSGFVNSALYNYQIILGGFNCQAFGTVGVPLVWTLFVISTVFIMIILLNLLVSIISNSYQNVSAAAEQAKYQERASMIAENNYLIPQEVKRTYAKEHGLILIATDLDKEEIPQGKDIIIGEVEKNQTILSEKITEVEGNINERLSALEETLNDIKSKNDKFESLEEKLGQIMALLQKD